MKRGQLRREDVYGFIVDYVRHNGYSPSVDDIAAGLNTAKSNIHYHLNILEKEGKMAHTPNIARSWRPT